MMENINEILTRLTDIVELQATKLEEQGSRIATLERKFWERSQDESES